MKIIRFLDPFGQEQIGTPTEDGPAELLDGALRPTGEHAVVHKLLAPLRPGAILGIGQNYRRHAEEMGGKMPEYPVLFFKNPASVQNPGDPIRLPRNLTSDSVDYECELAVVIGRPCRDATRENALDYVLGYTCGNDVSARDWQKLKGGSQWSRGKSFDTFCPLGPVLVTADEIPNPNALRIRTVLNGEAVQDWTTEDMIFDVRELIVFLSADTTLLPGTVLLTGTPHGVGTARKPPLYLKAGDTVTVEIEGIGALTNPVE
jgi:2-keto-4-pentenoate hydratase/2-oxohepta-3-ene-1,7-dioic acid hydratase in catechol pathway